MAATDIKAGRAYVEIATDDKNLKNGLVKMSAELDKFCRNARTIGMTALASAAAVAIPFGASMAVYANFESQMAKVAAITKATTAEVASLREQAKLLGKTTFFSASQVADAQKFLGMAGFNAKDIEAGLPSVLNLALAGNIDIGQAADIASNISTPFGIAAKDIQRVTDLLATAATSSNTDVTQMGEAMKYLAAGAASAGQSIEEMSAGLAILANNGIQSTMAGTAMRKMLSTLADQGAQVKLKEAFNVDVSDAAGNMRPLLSILQDIENATSKLTKTDQISVFFDLFGDRAANAALLLGKSGDAAVDFRLKMVNALGSSADMAKTMSDTIAGDFKSFMSAVEGTQIAVGEAFNDMSRNAVQFATGSIRGISTFISENQKLVQALGVSVAAVGTFGAASLAVGVGTPFFIGMTQGIEAATSKLNVLGKAMAAVQAKSAVAAVSSVPAWMMPSAASSASLVQAQQTAALVKQLGLANTATTRWAAGVMMMSNSQAAAAAKTALYGGAMSALNVKMVFSSTASKTVASSNAVLSASYKLLSADTYLSAGATAKTAAVQGIVALKTGIAAGTNTLLATSYKALAGATLLASSATKALGAAIYAIPGWGWALAGIAALAALTTYLVSASEHTAKLSDAMSKKRDTGDNTRQVDDMKMRRLEQIAALDKQSESDKKEAAKLVGDLQSRYGDFGATIDSVTGSLSLAGNAMQKFMDSMNAGAIRELEDELAEVEKNLSELNKERDNTSGGYWRGVGANVTLGYVDTSEDKLEKTFEKKAIELKKQHELKKKIAAIKGGDSAVDVAKTDDSRVSESLSTGGKTSSEVAADNVQKLQKLNEDLSRERKTQVENEIADVRNLSQEYQELLQSLITFEQKQVDAGLGDSSKLADYRKQLDDALGVEEERVMRILAKVEMPKPEDIFVTQKKMAVSELQLQLKTAKETGADTAAIESALAKAKVELDVTEFQQSSKNLSDASVELKAAIAAWEVASKGGTAEEKAVAAENVKKAEGTFSQSQSQFDTKSKILDTKPVSTADAILQLNLSNALVGGDKSQIETAKNDIAQSELAKALAELQAAQTAFNGSLDDLNMATIVGSDSEKLEAQVRLSGDTERLGSASTNYENLKAQMKDGLAESGKMSVSGTFSAQAAAAMGAGSVMDRVAKATEKSEKHLEKLATKTEPSEEKTLPETETDVPILETEMKKQTRYLRDIADKSGGVFA